MSNQGKNSKCQVGCWVSAAIAGAFAFAMLISVSGFSFFAALFVGALVCVLLGVLFNWLFCAPTPHAHYTSPMVSAGAAADVTAAAPVAKAAAPKVETQKVGIAPSAAPAVAEPAVEAMPAISEPETAIVEAVAVDDTPKVVPSASLAGQDELAARKGDWTYEAPAKEAASAPEEKVAPEEKAAAKKKAPAQKKATPKKAKKPAADQDFDGDGKVEGADEGTKPATLSAARDGGADDLKRIKGIGPKLEILCNELGFYHFDQISNWSAEETAWVNANLAGFKGRVTRDNWVEQATLLASGKETEFSKRVDKGSVY